MPITNAKTIDTQEGVELMDNPIDSPKKSKDVEGDSDKEEKKKSAKEELGPLSPASEIFSAFGRTSKIVLFRYIGITCAIVSGSVYPIMAFYFSKSFEKLGAPTGGGFMDDILELLIVFVILGIAGFIFLVLQSFFLEVAAAESTADYQKQWFDALLRQDMAYFDIKDVSSQATIVSAQAAKYKKGTGRKLGEGVQFTCTVIGGFIYAFYVSWRVSLIVLAAVPIMTGSSVFMMTVTTKQTERKNKGYAETGGIVYSTIAAIRTVYSLNAGKPMIEKFKASTKRNYDSSISFSYLVGLGSGAMMASFLVSYIALTLYGAYLLYDQVEKDGCDPSNTLGVNACKTVGTEVFGALMGISFGAMGLGQISNAIEAFMGARAAAHPALEAINRKVDDSEADIANVETPAVTTATGAEKRSDIVLPKYVIDSTSDHGKKPNSINGEIIFRDVAFAYPTRPESLVFNEFNLTVAAGKTVALVGPSGSGKSTTVSLLERFYDPTSGSITLDGTDLREINIQWLRDNIGLVSQEPTLFARTIRENIAYGMPGATMDDITNVAKAANAHDFISRFPNGYETQVGDKGAQLSGGQKQRIAIARVLLKNPKILLLDEATSALDSESEYVVQEALDNLLGKGNRTTIVIAHRLSTIRNADTIAVVKNGSIVESGTHSDLLARDGEYATLVNAQAPAGKAGLTPDVSSNALFDLDVGGDDVAMPQIEFKHVAFHYPSRPTNQIFSGLNLKIKKGETLAICGTSGGGKSTVVQMIERFYDPISGTVEYEGTDIRDFNVSWYRDQLGFVGQEPTLFNTTIAENIGYGCPGASQAQIEEAARQANAHEFITQFPHGYQTEVGENATQVSGGQKQRIAIARALIKKPKVLLLDEATSALDTESERVVQNAIDNIMESKSQTIIVIAHRLSTIRNADRIAVVSGGVLKEIGTHNELVAKTNGHYKRLIEFNTMDGGDKKKVLSKKDNTEEEDDRLDVSSHAGDELEEDMQKEEDKKMSKRAKMLASGDYGFFFVGAIGAVLAGLVFPGWGVVFAFMIELLFRPVFPCTDDTFEIDVAELTAIYGVDPFVDGDGVSYESCSEYQMGNAKAIEDLSYNVTYGWLGLMAATMIGNVLLFYGFGTATERMNKRVRDDIFTALLRQDVGYYDTHSVGKLSTQIEDDAAMIHSFSGEPIRTLTMTTASVLVGIVLSFVYMWPFAFAFLGLLPFMGFGAHMEMKMYMGEDEGADAPKPGDDGSGSIVVETLLSIRTVASLTIEKMRSKEYSDALDRENPASMKTNILKGLATGVGFLFQLWGMGFMFWWGGFVLDKWGEKLNITYEDFLISMFAALFSLSGLSVAMMGATDKTKAKSAASRIFKLIDRESPIDALSEEGKKGV